MKLKHIPSAIVVVLHLELGGKKHTFIRIILLILLLRFKKWKT